MGGFEKDLTVALTGSDVPIVLVTTRKDADFVISGRHQQKPREIGSDAWTEEASITVTHRSTGIVRDAFTLSDDSVTQLAQICAKRLLGWVEVPPELLVVPQPSSSTDAKHVVAPDDSYSRPVAVVAPTGRAGPSRILVQGDVNLFREFIDTLCDELPMAGIPTQIVRPGQEYDYNVVVAVMSNDVAAIAVDANRSRVASVVDSRFGVKDATEANGTKRLIRRHTLLERHVS